jgi:formamidopyrimidine-DNA glycosylase
MDQSKFSGIGNYLKCEILFDAKISPHRYLDQITDQDRDQLFRSMKKIYDESIENGGSKKYGDIFGNPGNFNLRIYENAKVGEKIKTADKRYTWFNPKIQN